ncbi:MULTISPECIES: hypothetical protein [Micromonospora]|uniref:Uncharacterized protein n=1 Tax=Micromonospora solifontis TaxID=2487138 RepID=A0ABX9WH64_9ACTN|nr:MULTISPECIES: hypothetical protein [Micromonospora]NES13931.1 hypothetical protein [Micromonospora sp. PPF5-17B]NES37510.1 hypothetical protein [Micromonospora solifontis]NES54031.1 hypothetical protein [Micromonospora sp. PPF5-6]RNL98323.1 hypothetical protein EFE23_15300 [Micromonospora solifontis]
MVRQVRRLLAGAVIATACGFALAGPTAAQAAPKPKLAPAGVDISGDKLDQPLQLRADTHPAEVNAVVDQVKWLGPAGQQRGPKADDLGPKYTVVLLYGGTPTKTYDLYPLAKGGPRVYRPAKQPDLSKTRAGWFYGRLTMSEVLRTAGVPLERQYDTISGGIGGGDRVIPEEALDPVQDIDSAMGELQRLLLLNVGVMVVITAGLAGIALLVRRRTR